MGKQEILIEDLAAAAEVMGQEVRPAGLLAMSDELMAYPLELSRAALIRVRRECRRLTLADILERIETADGRPLADEAWATAILAMEESETFIWTLETQQAFAVARPLVEINDRVGARMAFHDAYARLVGLNLMQGFRQAVRERLGGVLGCTHITDLAQVLPTAVVQAFAGVVFDTRGDSPEGAKPFQIDRCQALRSDGATVPPYYPRWYRPAAPSAAIPFESERASNP